MSFRILSIFCVFFGCVGMLSAQEDPGYGLAVEPTSFGYQADAGCLADCGDLSGCAATDRFHIDGWIDGGFMLNGDKAPSGYHGSYNQTDRHEGSLNQAYLVLERSLKNSSCLSLGGRVDLLYGTDFFLGQSKGLEKQEDGSGKWNGAHYGLAVPQAYGEVGNDRISFKLGHFYTIVGYEGVPSVNNFFYSKSLSYQFAGPFVQWGGLATWKATDRLVFDAGVVNGWDALDREVDRASFLGRVSWGNDQDLLWSSFSIITGDEMNDQANEATSRTRMSWIIGSNLTCKLQYVLHPWYGVQDNFLANGDTADWYGIDQYLYYRLNPCYRLGARFEWFHDDEGVRLGLGRPGNPNTNPFVGDMYSISAGVNWEPCDKITVRPEVRYDWFSGAGSPFKDGNSDDQFLVGLDAIWRF